MTRVFILITSLFISVFAFGQIEKEIQFTSDKWNFSQNAKYEFKKVDGRQSLELDGRATLKDVSFTNGSIQVAVYAKTARSFAGIFFRHQKGHGDEVYMRMHKNGKPDALQYTPIFNGESNWQLYKEHQANITFKSAGWNMLRVEVLNYTARVFVNGQFVLEVPKLKSENGKGTIGLWALFGNVFSGMTVSSETSKNSKVLYPKKPKKGVVTAWELSRPHVYESDKVFKPSDFKSEEYTWATTEASGLLPISKYVVKPSKGAFENNQEDYVIARLLIESIKVQSKELFFDFSDKIMLYLNDEQIFEGDNSFRSKGIGYQGHLAIDRNSVELPLKKGLNIIHAVVLEKANGWGLIGKLENMKVISVKH
ncbi:family 16 glycoside hydrolase [uncultured Maribacter sp.]|uniref:family 16 glycoside hydrolase n=1 Tax=uncultured Maribacter sp. TaxID=431308 RepID=UPI00262FBE7B|nr:family 16 glycoside hydrolase [uncultured Maribacter sp.]